MLPGTAMGWAAVPFPCHRSLLQFLLRQLSLGGGHGDLGRDAGGGDVSCRLHFIISGTVTISKLSQHISIHTKKLLVSLSNLETNISLFFFFFPQCPKLFLGIVVVQSVDKRWWSNLWFQVCRAQSWCQAVPHLTLLLVRAGCCSNSALTAPHQKHGE